MHREREACGRYNFLHYVGSAAGYLESTLPGSIVHGSSVEGIAIGRVIVRTQHQLLAILQDEVEQVDRFFVVGGRCRGHHTSPRNEVADSAAFGGREAGGD